MARFTYIDVFERKNMERLPKLKPIQAVLKAYVNAARGSAQSQVNNVSSRYRIRFVTSKGSVDHYLTMTVRDTEARWRPANSNPALGVEFGRAGFLLGDGTLVEDIEATYLLHRSMGLTPGGSATDATFSRIDFDGLEG